MPVLKAFVIAVCALVPLLLPGQASAALVCDASVQDVSFGQVSVRDGARDTTISNIQISCSGGTANASARICLDIGAGSGGAGAGQSPRYLSGPQGALLDYQLTSGNHFGSGGTVWTQVQFDMSLNAEGAGSISPALYAEIASSGTEHVGGSFVSSFAAGADVTLSYGEQSTCTTAGSVSGFQVSAEVTPSCTIRTWPLDFGNIVGTISTPIDDATVIDVSCTDGTPYAVRLGLGMGSGVTDPARRRMMNGAEPLVYGLYRDAARTVVWGDSAGNDLEGAGTGTSQSVPVYGRIQAPQSVPVGTYTDSVVVTIEY